MVNPVNNQNRSSEIISHIQNMSNCLPEQMRQNPDMETVRAISELPEVAYITKYPSYQLFKRVVGGYSWESHIVSTYHFESDTDLVDMIRKEFRENWRCFVLYNIEEKRVRGNFVSPDTEARKELTIHMRNLIIGEITD